MASSILAHAHSHLTPQIGTLFSSSFQLSSLLASSSTAPVTSLAHLISSRGVVCFRSQNITAPQQSTLAELLGRHSTSKRPAEHGLHRHPISEETPEISVISSDDGGISRAGLDLRSRASNGWHSDISFEECPADYSILKMHTIPETGGDTLFASGYAAYERLSPFMQKFLEGLSAVHSAPFFVEMARQKGIKIKDNRGSPLNSGDHLAAIHPVVRTHPITQRKCLFVNKSFTTRIVELHPEESDSVLDYLFRHVAENHDMQARFKWKKDDIAIWDNRCTYHTGTNDYSAAERRSGDRAVSVGERPYL